MAFQDQSQGFPLDSPQYNLILSLRRWRFFQIEVAAPSDKLESRMALDWRQELLGEEKPVRLTALYSPFFATVRDVRTRCS